MKKVPNHSITSKLMNTVNKIRFQGEIFSNHERVVDKVLVSVPDKYESEMSLLEYPSKIT